MPRVSPIQDSFQAGELGARVRGRTTINAYKNGLGKARNWFPLVQGPMRMRQGSQYISPVDEDNWQDGLPGNLGLRVFTFQRGVDEDIIIEVGSSPAGQLIAKDAVTGGGLTGGVTENLIPDPNFSTIPFLGLIPPFQSAVWDTDFEKHSFGTDPGRPRLTDCVTPSGAVLTTLIPGGIPRPTATILANTEFSPNGFQSAAIENAVAFPVILPAGSELLLNEFSYTFYLAETSGNNFEDGDFGTFPLDDPQIRFSVGTTKGASDVFTALSQIANLGTDGYITITHTFTPGGGNNTLYFSISLEWTGTNPTVPDVTSGTGCVDDDPINIGFCDLEWIAPLTGGSGTPVEFASPYTQTQLECLQVAMDPGEQEMWFTHPEVETHRLKLAVGEWTFEPISTITTPTPFVGPTPNNWGAGNHPAACAFHEGRLWLGGSPSDPATLWASRSGDYADFGNAGAAQADDPLLFPLSSSGNIMTLTSRKELVINTDISEVVGTSEAGIITFEDFSFPKQTDWGSNCVQPIVVGRDMVFTSNSRNRVRTFSDEGGTNYGWDGNELSLLAQEIFHQKIRRMEYLDEPAYQACFLLNDGTMGMATYFYPENVVGWWRYDTAYNGDRASGDTTLPGLLNQTINLTQQLNQIMDITKVNTSGGAKLWMVINRVGYPGTLLPGHELLAFEDPILPPTTLDSWSIRPINPTTRTIEDIDHLTDQSINCIIERPAINTGGAPSYTVHPNITAVAGVSSPLEDWAAESNNNAIVGLFYDNEFQLLPREGVSNRGTSQVSKRRWNKIYARLNNSAVPLINGEPPKDRTPATPMGQGEPRITGDVEYSELGSDQGEITISQDKPILSEVLALFGKLTSTEV